MLQIHKPYSAVELNVIIEVTEVKCLSPEVRIKTSNYVSRYCGNDLLLPASTH